MSIVIEPESLLKFGLKPQEASQLANSIAKASEELTAEESWQIISTELLKPFKNFELDKFIYRTIYPNWQLPSPAWLPTKTSVAKTNIALSMKELNLNNYPSFHKWSIDNFAGFWDFTIKSLGIKFQVPYKKIVELSNGAEKPFWLPQARFNIIDSCFNAAKNSRAIIYQAENSELLQTVSYQKLATLVNRMVFSLRKQGFDVGDKIAIIMPMNIEAVALYLAIIKMGGVVVSIADSFAPQEIAIRLKITNTKAVFTQDFNLRDQKKLPLYQKICEANAPITIVFSVNDKLAVELRSNDLAWHDFLSSNEDNQSAIVAAQDHANILFSSGTTGEPKAIPWNHSTPIKCASDAYYHLDIHSEDVLAWPTNLGWMMGPWLVFASLMNGGTIALFGGTPNSSAFGKFIQNAKVTMLGVVPSLVKTWRASHCMEAFDWSAIKLFASTGECSNPEDMLYLMWLAGYRPIIEYCGGTEIGGAYITSTPLQPSAPAAFTTPALGLDFVLLDEEQQPANAGEVALTLPSIGLSTELINRDHYEVYYEGMPETKNGWQMRRHGDQIEKIGNYYRALGRVDDTMNLGAIKVSSAEIERVLSEISEIIESAAIAISPTEGGPSELVIYVVLEDPNFNSMHELKNKMQKVIREQLNPLFKISEVVPINALPRTSSNKVMRRLLRDKFY